MQLHVSTKLEIYSQTCKREKNRNRAKREVLFFTKSSPDIPGMYTLKNFGTQSFSGVTVTKNENHNTSISWRRRIRNRGRGRKEKPGFIVVTVFLIVLKTLVLKDKVNLGLGTLMTADLIVLVRGFSLFVAIFFKNRACLCFCAYCFKRKNRALVVRRLVIEPKNH